MAKATSNDADVEFIAALADLLRSNDLSELEVSRETGEDQGLTVRLSRGGVVAPQMVAATVPAPAAPIGLPQPELDAQPAAAASDPADDPNSVTSPMPGTIYLQPEPGAAAFVNVGDKVSEGQTILIIEAMKTMNQIPAPRAGTVKRIVVDDGAPVEYGSPLIVLE